MMFKKIYLCKTENDFKYCQILLIKKGYKWRWKHQNFDFKFLTHDDKYEPLILSIDAYDNIGWTYERLKHDVYNDLELIIFTSRKDKLKRIINKI